MSFQVTVSGGRTETRTLAGIKELFDYFQSKELRNGWREQLIRKIYDSNRKLGRVELMGRSGFEWTTRNSERLTIEILQV